MIEAAGFGVGMFGLYFVGLLCYICIFYYSYVDSLTYAFGWSAFFVGLGLHFVITDIVVIFFK
jgi:hypothetical protein